MAREIGGVEFGLRSLPLMGVGLVLAISTRMTDTKKLWGMLALEIVLGIAAIGAWIVKA